MAMSKKKLPSNLRPQTKIVTAGQEFTEHGFLNPAVYRGSTIVLDDLESFRNNPHAYGRRGTPTSRALESAVAALEGGYDARVTPSGLSAISTALLSYLNAGDHVLVTDAVYHPARHFCDTVLKRLGIETTYYDPLAAAELSNLVRSNTRLIFCETPGSQTMEVQDIPALANVAHRHGALLLVDNSWSGGHYFKAFEHGADIVLQSASKYIGGHSDILMGTIAATETAWPPLAETYGSMGMFAGPDDMYMALRGLRTLDVRLARHMQSAIAVAEWLRTRPEVETVLHPALSNAPGHSLWKRDFTGSSGLFSVILKPCSDTALTAMIDGLTLFGLGFGWGGFESLCTPFKPKRVASVWQATGPCLRFHIGLEHTDDLIADLADGFNRLRSAT
jgi:cysteine-S-conjugate beta-lyase